MSDLHRGTKRPDSSARISIFPRTSSLPITSTWLPSAASFLVATLVVLPAVGVLLSTCSAFSRPAASAARLGWSLHRRGARRLTVQQASLARHGRRTKMSPSPRRVSLSATRVSPSFVCSSVDRALTLLDFAPRTFLRPASFASTQGHGWARAQISGWAGSIRTPST